MMGRWAAAFPVWVGALAVAGAQAPEGGPEERIVSDALFRRVAVSLARADWTEGRGEDSSHAFFVGDGVFLTVRPGAALSEEVTLRTAQGTRDARVVLVDPPSGMVLLSSANRLDETLEPLPLGASRTLFVGDSVFAIRVDPRTGEALGTSVGMVIGRDRRVDGKSLEVAHLRVQLNGVVSLRGMPVFDHRGQVVGLDLGEELDDGGEEFHVLPVEMAAKLVSDLKEFGRRVDAWIGLRFNTGTTTAKVVAVRPGSPGAVCGVLPGDVVIHFAGARIDTIEDLSDSCHTLTAGRAAEIHLLRGVDRIECVLTPGRLADKPADAPSEGPP
jgi:S1-C subfamily serine protease